MIRKFEEMSTHTLGGGCPTEGEHEHQQPLFVSANYLLGLSFKTASPAISQSVSQSVLIDTLHVDTRQVIITSSPTNSNSNY